MRVLVIGGTGLISSEVVPELVRRGHDVACFHRGVTPRALPEGVRSLIGDRKDSARLGEVVEQHGPWDCVIDMVNYGPDDSEQAVELLSGRTSQYLMVSSVDVYAAPAHRYPITEDEPYGGIAGYALDKVNAEKVLWQAHEEGRLPVTIFRMGTTYCPGDPPAATLGRRTSLLDRLRRGLPVVVHGDGTGMWPQWHSKDTAIPFANACGNPATLGRAYNVCGDEVITWNQHLGAIAKALDGPEPTLIHIPTDALGVLCPQRAELVVDNLHYTYIYDTSRAQAELGLRQTITLEEGLREWVASMEAAGIERAEDDPLESILIDTWLDLVSKAAVQMRAADLDGSCW